MLAPNLNEISNQAGVSGPFHMGVTGPQYKKGRKVTPPSLSFTRYHSTDKIPAHPKCPKP